MYMYYFLGHQLMDNPNLTDAQKEVGDWQRSPKKVRAENTFLLALDGDVDFQPEAIIKVGLRDTPLGTIFCAHLSPYLCLFSLFFPLKREAFLP